MPRFNDAENVKPFVPEGDYIFTVVDFESKISTGPKTGGSDQFELKLKIEHNTVYETLTDHESCQWRFDTFLKCCGVKLVKGEAYDFRKDVAAENGIRWIDVRGLRGWCALSVDEYKGRKRNRVAVFYTDRQKLPPILQDGEEETCPF